MILLAIESSCDESSVAVVKEGVVLTSLISSQIQLHSEYGGVVPELATRAHLKNLLPLARSALEQCGKSPPDIDCVAATQGPGLPQALLVGFVFGQALAASLQKPFFGIHHHEAHLYSPWVLGKPPASEWTAFQPHVSLIVSGGHTLLLEVVEPLKHRVLGGTMDDAAGECFDKTAKLMGLPYPGGPEMDRLAGEGNPKAYDFPRPLLHDSRPDFSFAGLKTSVRYFLQKNPEVLDNPQRVRDLCASVQAAIVEVLVNKTIRAAEQTGHRFVTASGGVTCNRELRRQLQEECGKRGMGLRLAPGFLCTDNAAMIGILATEKFKRGFSPTPLDEEIRPSWELPGIFG
jgi:N6-L-threonylcarbamoyladenine synthase